MHKLFLIVLALSLFMAGCEDPAANKFKAQTSAPSNSETNSSSKTLTAAAVSLPITPENSKIGFTGSKVTGKHEGGFKSFAGSIDLVGEKAQDSRVKVEIEMKSVFTDTDQLTGHLQTGDFFEVDKFPTSSFVSTKIVPDTAKGQGNYSITGDLEMRGVKKSITFPATIAITPSDVSVNSEFAINRKDFGIVYAGKADDLVRDDVVIHLDLKTLRQK
jgi:polyisoprenoid-binding protein YceI